MFPEPSVIKENRNGTKSYAYDRKVSFVCHTDGRGYWSKSKKKIVHNKLRLWYDSGENHGSLNVFFNKEYWDIENHGLIYTDDNWLKEFKAELKRIGFKKFKADFSEQGLQGDNYVDLDVDKSFAKEYFNLLYTKKELQLGSFSNRS
jgi:hypothetical protein